MSIAQSLLPEFDQEMANTRKVLERIPEDKLEWKPDPKSMSLGRLAGHVAEMPGWGMAVLSQDSFDVAPQGQAPYEALTAKSRQHLLAEFDKNISEARAALAGISDEQMMKPWTLKAGGNEIFTMPRIGVIRTMVMNHVIHHRAQLTVYFRLTGVPVPGLYGPSADEQQAPIASNQAAR
jgi:uncharacterized damage-inducible protein DinB